MKHTALLTTLFLSAVSLSAVAVNVPTLQLDSVVSTTVPETIYDYSRYKVAFTSDATGQQTTRISYVWNSLKGEWLKSTKFEQTRDDQGNVLVDNYYGWNSKAGDWLASSKTVNTFNSNGRCINELVYFWNQQTNQWDNVDNTEWAYNQAGQQTLYIDYRWNTETNQWVETKKVEYTYLDIIREASRTEYNWNTTTNQWVGVIQRTSRYNEQGNLTERIEQTWDNTLGQWTWSTKQENTYNDAQNTTLGTIYTWNQGTNQWEQYKKWEKTDDPIGYHITQRQWSWNAQQSTWMRTDEVSVSFNEDGRSTVNQYLSYVNDSVCVGGGKSEYVYDAYGNETNTMRYVWSVPDKKWKGSKKTEKAFNANNQVDELLTFKEEVRLSNGRQLTQTYKEFIWNEATDDWNSTPNRAEQFYYSTLTPAITALKTNHTLDAYLDPVSQTLYIDDEDLITGALEDRTVRVYAVSGTLLLTTPRHVINFSNYPKGIYLVTVNGQTCRVLKR